MIFHEWSLIFFTVLAQTAVGGYLLIGARALVLGHDEEKLNSYKVPMFILWALMGLGFMFSTTHLGSPLRAFNAFNQLGSAWLSNEVFFGAAFFAVGGLQWLLSVVKKGGVAIQKALMVGAMVLGVIFMYAMINVYMINTVPTWDNIYTPLSFIMTMVVGGLLLSQFVIVFANDSRFTVDRNITMLAVIAVAISLLVTVGKLNLIGEIQTSAAKASELVDGLGSYVILQVALLMASLLIWILPMLNKAKVNPVNLGLALVLFLASELIGRGLFYSLHMTSGL
ncbi:dimethyl sulfoxide reductase anchor subunit family protein [Vibrio crassostreae]|uniref:dimethyl sulfoxide reductase anchor subunit family protein n=1 Tax=Vibrio crassostreae TaxID=246167 RepID=UPI000F4622C2|nr:DmsC/YnfH family molybdoenzyme membrane anchor subunit [Vibrio crassostreae]ROS63271.1 anaerobic dimethyl sulfoxide reductase subunit C (anchor subunit) [Vibrio crassostreae]RPF16797.1 anaerobic dimethyl sulfoxide reductase subunit C (anchor subunit) [Vibrio crassostreae]TCN99677.1 anaerobic dimethyl sulfoxide reductase subunit C (anchor subunit) [Vibrio crassostreae]CAK2145714.1 dimethyl sulfoxide reductase subunit C [Vibrio crassostreae]CAK2159066.1 dimethyl sulfoxide reductase subunit C 